MFLNVIHRADGGPASREALAFQLDVAHRLGLKVTTLVSYQGFLDAPLLDYLREQREKFGDEIGIHLHELMCEDFRARFDTNEPAIYLQTKEKKRDILAYIFARFDREFGHSAKVIGSYILDAWTLCHIRTNYPSVVAAISNCFEEGVKMFHGNNHNWCLFSDGGPWGAFRPSRKNALCPALDETDDIGIVALPHLNRDMIHAITGRDDLMSSHPVNLFRGKINEGSDCPYWFRFTDQWIEQGLLNDLVYYSFFVSSPWLMETSLFTDDFREARVFYQKSLAYLAQKRSQGSVRDVTMSEFAEIFRARSRVGAAQACHWRDVLTDSRRQMFWFANPHFRVAIDLVAGGAISELRPYAGRVDGDLGPDTAAQWNGNYPFVLSAELRGGHWRNHLACVIKVGGSSRSVMDFRTTGRAAREGNTWTLRIDPVKIKIGTASVVLMSVLRFDQGETITIERHVLECDSPEISIREELRGSWGTNEYPENLNGIRLYSVSQDMSRDENVFAYRGQTRRYQQLRAIGAELPMINTRLELRATEKAKTGETVEGVLFDPGFTLALEQTLSAPGFIRTEFSVTGINSTPIS